MSKKRGVYILGARRTPFGKFFGALGGLEAWELAAEAVGALTAYFSLGLSRSDIGVEGVVLGNVLSAGLGQAPARHACRIAGLSDYCPADLVSKVCASSLLALRVASREIQVGEAGLMIAGGMESMSRTPHLLERKSSDLAQGFRKKLSDIKHDPYVFDSMIFDGLLDSMAVPWRTMGEIADNFAKTRFISREHQEAYAYESFRRATDAQKAGKFKNQIAEIRIGLSGQEKPVDADEGIREPDIDKIRKLKPVFVTDGTVTAATSAQISDGAAVLLIGDSRSARRFGVVSRIRVADIVTHSQPKWYTSAPVGAIKKILHRNNLKISDISFFEINEAFAVVPIYAMRELGIPHEKLNIWGGAIALGHPLGASGARLVMNAEQQLLELGGRYAIASVCNGGDEAMAVLIENIMG